jgi:prephenate dehydrogenase
VGRAGIRPRLAIVGGGGAMGRLFARLLGGAARELYLFDFFGSGPRPANVSQALDEIRSGVGARGFVGPAAGLIPSGTESGGPDTTLWRIASGDLHGERAIARLAPGPDPAGDRFAWPTNVLPLGPLVEQIAALNASGCTVVAGPPADAPVLLPKSDVILLALGFESQAAYAENVRFYAPWLRPGALVVDLGSTKSRPMATLARELPTDVGLLGAHPLFGPTVSDLTGLIVAAVDSEPGRADSPWQGWFLEQLAELRMIVVPATAEEHDDAMGFVQALTHFALLAFAYTFVRLDRDPADLLTLRTPVFEPLLYLAARVAYLARSSPDTYRAIQTFSTRPDARLAFLEAAHEVLAAIEQTPAGAAPGSGDRADPLTALFRRYGEPWSPEGRDRRDRQRREHLLEMGVRLVDHLNDLRQEIVGAVGQVRAIEERRAGQPRRVVVGVVDLDLLDPGKYDVASRIRLRRLNLSVGSTHGGAVSRAPGGDDTGSDLVIPLARARILRDDELLSWLYETDQLIERRSFPLTVPDWFDEDVLSRLLKGRPGFPESGASQIWHASLRAAGDGRSPGPGTRAALLTLAIVVHPSELVAARQEVQQSGEDAFRAALSRIEADLAEVRRQTPGATDEAVRPALLREKDRLKHARKALIDRRTAEVDREVRRLIRGRVQRICEETIDWLLRRGCSLGNVAFRSAPGRTGPNAGVFDSPLKEREQGR